MIVDSSALMAIPLGEPEGQTLAEAMARADELSPAAPDWLEAMIVIRARLGAAETGSSWPQTSSSSLRTAH